MGHNNGSLAPSSNGLTAHLEKAVTLPTSASESGSTECSGTPRCERSQLDSLHKIVTWGIAQVVLAIAPDAKVDIETAAVLMGVSEQEARRCTQRHKGRPPRLPSQRGRRRRVIIPLAALVAYMNGDRRQEGGAR